MAHGYPSKSKIRSYFIKPFMLNKTTFHTGAKGGPDAVRQCTGPDTVGCRGDSKGATVYYKGAVINFCDNEGHLKPRHVKMPIAVRSFCLGRNRYAPSSGTVHNSASRRG